MCTTCMFSAPSRQKRKLDSLKLESQAVVSHHVGLGTEFTHPATAPASRCLDLKQVLSEDV